MSTMFLSATPAFNYDAAYLSHSRQSSDTASIASEQSEYQSSPSYCGESEASYSPLSTASSLHSPSSSSMASSPCSSAAPSPRNSSTGSLSSPSHLSSKRKSVKRKVSTLEIGEAASANNSDAETHCMGSVKEEDEFSDAEEERRASASSNPAQALSILMEKKERRKAQNRSAAATSRLRKKAYISEMEEKMNRLAAQSKAMEEQLRSLMAENQRLKMVVHGPEAASASASAVAPVATETAAPAEEVSVDVPVLTISVADSDAAEIAQPQEYVVAPVSPAAATVPSMIRARSSPTPVAAPHHAHVHQHHAASFCVSPTRLHQAHHVSPQQQYDDASYYYAQQQQQHYHQQQQQYQPIHHQSHHHNQYPIEIQEPQPYYDEVVPQQYFDEQSMVSMKLEEQQQELALNAVVEAQYYPEDDALAFQWGGK